MAVLAVSLIGIGMCVKMKTDHAERIEEAVPVDPMQNLFGKFFKITSVLLVVSIVYAMAKAVSGIYRISGKDVSDDMRSFYYSTMRNARKKEMKTRKHDDWENRTPDGGQPV